MKKRTIIVELPDGTTIISKTKDKYQAGMIYDRACANYGSDRVRVYDPDGEYCDPCEL